LIAHNKHALNATLMVGIGGAFEVMAGLAKRAPKWAQKAGLEWLYRFIQEPKRLFRRYFIEAPLFIPINIKQKFGAKNNNYSTLCYHLNRFTILPLFVATMNCLKIFTPMF